MEKVSVGPPGIVAKNREVEYVGEVGDAGL